MQVLQYASLFPDSVARISVISSTGFTSPVRKTTTRRVVWQFVIVSGLPFVFFHGHTPLAQASNALRYIQRHAVTNDAECVSFSLFPSCGRVEAAGRTHSCVNLLHQLHGRALPAGKGSQGWTCSCSRARATDVSEYG